MKDQLTIKIKKIIMKTFKDVQIGQTFFTTNGRPSRKISDTKAVSLRPELIGFDFQEAKMDVEFSQSPNSHVYGIKK
jgi:hypothetical protein